MGAPKEVLVRNVDAYYPDADPDAAKFGYRLN